MWAKIKSWFSFKPVVALTNPHLINDIHKDHDRFKVWYWNDRTYLLKGETNEFIKYDFQNQVIINHIVDGKLVSIADLSEYELAELLEKEPLVIEEIIIRDRVEELCHELRVNKRIPYLYDNFYLVDFDHTLFYINRDGNKSSTCCSVDRAGLNIMCYLNTRYDEPRPSLYIYEKDKPRLERDFSHWSRWAHLEETNANDNWFIRTLEEPDATPVRYYKLHLNFDSSEINNLKFNLNRLITEAVDDVVPTNNYIESFNPDNIIIEHNGLKIDCLKWLTEDYNLRPDTPYLVTDTLTSSIPNGIHLNVDYYDLDRSAPYLNIREFKYD